MEFLGDSETSGFGNLGPSQPGAPGLRSLLTVNIAHQDGNQAWPALAAKALDADFHNIAWSGAGVLAASWWDLWTSTCWVKNLLPTEQQKLVTVSCKLFYHVD